MTGQRERWKNWEEQHWRRPGHPYPAALSSRVSGSLRCTWLALAGGKCLELLPAGHLPQQVLPLQVVLLWDSDRASTYCFGGAYQWLPTGAAQNGEVRYPGLQVSLGYLPRSGILETPHRPQARNLWEPTPPVVVNSLRFQNIIGCLDSQNVHLDKQLIVKDIQQLIVKDGSNFCAHDLLPLAFPVSPSTSQHFMYWRKRIYMHSEKSKLSSCILQFLI